MEVIHLSFVSTTLKQHTAESSAGRGVVVSMTHCVPGGLRAASRF